MTFGCCRTGRAATAAAALVLTCAEGPIKAQTLALSPAPNESAGPAPAGTAADAAHAQSLLKARLAQSVAIADLDRDGLADVAVVDFLADAVKLWFGDAAGGFVTTTTLPTGRGPRSVIAADFNNDRVVDLAVGEFLSGSVRVFIGRGDGRFAAGHALALAQGTSSLVARDVDDDGRIDLAAANALSGAIVLLKNTGPGSFAATRIGRAPAPTLLLFQDVNRDGTPDLVAVDAEGRSAQVFAGDAAVPFQFVSAVDSSAVGALAEASLDTASPPGGARLTKIAGDGQAQRGGAAAREPLLVEVRDFAGAARAGANVSFSRLAGAAEIMEPGLQGSLTAAPRSTDNTGRAWLSLLLPQLPDVNVMAASLAPDHIAAFGVVSLMKNDEIARLITAAWADESQDVRALAALRASLRDTLGQLDRNDSPAAIRQLAATLDQWPTPRAGTTAPSAAGDAATLTRRLLNQILLMGPSPQAADNEPITCDVPLTRTIASPAEVDRFTFDGLAGERVHVTMGNEGGTFGFNPVWRLLAPDANPVAGCDPFSGADRICTLPAAGAYAIEVEDGAFDATGTYSLQIQRLTAAQRCGTAIACDVPASTTISLRADTDLHQFTAIAGERLHITMGNEGGTFGFNPVWRLLAPDANPVTGCDTFVGGERECTLPAAGAYAIEVEDGAFDATGTYSLQIQRLTVTERCGTAIACDVPASTTVSLRADTDLHQFTAAAGERLHITMGNEGGTFGFNPVWRLLAPDANPVTGCDTFVGGERECTLPAAGAYAIEVEDGAFDATGTYSLQIQRLTAAQRCGTAIACDVPAATTVSLRADTDLHQFTAAAGERLHITMGNEGGTFGFNPVWRLLAPDANPVAGCDPFSGADRICTLPAAGAYAIEVEDGAFDATGTYSLQIQRLTAAQRCGTAIACDVPAATTISLRADTDLHQFTAAAGERLHITMGNEGGTFGFNPVWRLVAPDASFVVGCDTFGGGDRICTLPPSPDCRDLGGTSVCTMRAPLQADVYAIEVEDQNFDGTGTYSLQIQHLAAPHRCATIICSDPVSGAISARADTDLYQFEGVANEVVHVTLNNLGGTFGFNPMWQLVDPNGNPVAGCGFSSADRDCTLPQVGAYAVEVEDQSFDGTGTYRLTVVSSSGCAAGGLASAQLDGDRTWRPYRTWRPTSVGRQSMAIRLKPDPTYESQDPTYRTRTTTAAPDAPGRWQSIPRRPPMPRA